MKRLLRLTAIAGLLCLTGLGVACGTIPTSNPAYPGPETEPPLPTGIPVTAITSIPVTVPPLPTIPNHYPPSTEAIPTDTLPPEPRPTTTPMPTITPPPTTVPLPPPAFYVLWAETTYTNGQPNSGTIWRADPRDPADRQTVLRLDGEEIGEAILSPNGQQIAFTAQPWKAMRSLWVVNLDGTELRQVTQNVGLILWGQNSQTIFYITGGEGWAGIEQIHLGSGVTQRILTIEQAEPVLIPLGWSTDSHWLHHIRRNSEYTYELWKTRRDGSESQFIVSLGKNLPYPDYLLLSPNGSKLLLGTYQKLRWISTDGQKEGEIELPRPGQGYGVLWGHGDNEVIIGQTDLNYSHYYLYVINIQSQQARELAKFEGYSWGQLALSPDRHWLMASQWEHGFYWIHLPTGTTIPTPCQDCRTRFIAWIPKGSGP